VHLEDLQQLDLIGRIDGDPAVKAPGKQERCVEAERDRGRAARPVG
jgi:hypothetical protein